MHPVTGRKLGIIVRPRTPSTLRGHPASRSNTALTLPATPTRARSVFDARHRPDLAPQQPSPASSSELSPVAKDMMANLRKQRLRIQHAARKSGRGLRAGS